MLDSGSRVFFSQRNTRVIEIRALKFVHHKLPDDMRHQPQVNANVAVTLVRQAPNKPRVARNGLAPRKVIHRVNDKLLDNV